jgi:hypothetical protein
MNKTHHINFILCVLNCINIIIQSVKYVSDGDQRGDSIKQR